MSQCYSPSRYVVHFKGALNSGEAQDRQQKPVDPKILDAYTGLYEGNLRITRDVTRLMAQSPDDKEKVELLAVSKEAFSIRGEGDSILFVFEKDPQNQIVALPQRGRLGKRSQTHRLVIRFHFFPGVLLRVLEDSCQLPSTCLYWAPALLL